MSDTTLPPRMLAPVAILTATGAAFLLFAWCTLDYFLVRSPRYPHGVHDYDWLLLWSPLVVFALDYVISLRLLVSRRWTACAVATLCAIPLGVALIFQFGVSFHLWLGGRL
jgi:hypothetical protein